MLRLETILCATDFSAGSKAALAQAVFLARSLGAELHLLHVVLVPEDLPDWVRHAFPEDEDPLPKLMARADRKLARAVPEPLEDQIAVHRESRQGPSVVATLLDYAAQIDADLVVLGGRGASGTGLGSVALRVIRHADRPVLVIPVGGVLELAERVLVPIDFSPHSQAAARIAGDLAALVGARLELVHAVDPSHLGSFYGPHGLEELTDRVTAEARSRLHELADELSAGDGEIEPFVVTGRAGPRLVRFAKERGAGLIVLSSHGRTGLRRLLLGSVSERVIRGAEVPVLTLKAFGKLPASEAAAAAVISTAPGAARGRRLENARPAEG